MSSSGQYEPAGGWSGQVIANAPAAAPVPAPIPVPVAPDARPAPPGPRGPGFLALLGGLLIARVFVEVLLALMFLYVVALVLASSASFGDSASAIFINVVLVLVSLPFTRAVLQVVIGWRTALGPLAIALLIGLGVRFTFGVVGAPVAVGMLAALPLQAIVLFAISDSFSNPYVRAN